METNELMIGDWVLYDKQPYKVRQLGIYSTNRDGDDYPAVCVGKPNGIGLIVKREDIEPILLTPEILEKNGFYYGYTSREEDAASNTITSLSETDKGWCWDEGGGAIKVIFPNEADGGLVELDDQSFNRYMSFVFCDNLYVHELQHVLKLCGIEKEIIL